jgi:hypothetical protein
MNDKQVAAIEPMIYVAGSCSPCNNDCNQGRNCPARAAKVCRKKIGPVDLLTLILGKLFFGGIISTLWIAFLLAFLSVYK